MNRITLRLVSLAALAFVSMASVADAHRAYRGVTYPDDRDQVLYYFETDFPGGDGGSSTYKEAFNRSIRPWNNLGRRLRFEFGGWREIDFDPRFREIGDNQAGENYCALNRNGRVTPQNDRRPISLVFWEPLPDDDPGYVTLGEATNCTGANGHSKFMMAFNSSLADTWYRGENPRVPRGEGTRDGPGAMRDFASVAVHELGHATGWRGHLAPRRDPYNGTRGANCNRYSSNRETMCPTITSGTPWGRSLQRHDRHTFEHVYP